VCQKPKASDEKNEPTPGKTPKVSDEKNELATGKTLMVSDVTEKQKAGKTPTVSDEKKKLKVKKVLKVSDKKKKAKKKKAKKAFNFSDAISYDKQAEEWKEADKLRRACLLRVLTDSYDEAKVELLKIGVVIGRGGARVKMRLSFQSGEKVAEGFELAHYERSTRKIVVRAFNPDKVHPLLMTLIHELFHSWFHQVVTYLRALGKMDMEEEGACEFFAYLLLAKKFNCVYARSLVTKEPSYLKAFNTLYAKLKPSEDANAITYVQIRKYLDIYVESRKHNPDGGDEGE